MVFHALVGYFSVNLLITNHIHRIEAVAHPLDPFAQCPPQHGDARIRRREDFQGMHGDRPLAYPAPRDHRACADVLRISALAYWAPARATTAINVLVTLAAVMRDRCRCRAYSRSGRRRTAEPTGTTKRETAPSPVDTAPTTSLQWRPRRRRSEAMGAIAPTCWRPIGRQPRGHGAPTRWARRSGWRTGSASRPPTIISTWLRRSRSARRRRPCARTRSGVAARPLDAHRAVLLVAASVLTVGSSSRRQQASSPSRWLERNCLENAIPTGDRESCSLQERVHCELDHRRRDRPALLGQHGGLHSC
jgi:hypothetical protein